MPLAKSKIVAELNAQESPVFKHSELSGLFELNRANWAVPQSMSFEAFLDYLQKNSKLRRHRLEFPNRPETVFAWGEVSAFCIANAVKPKSFLSHYSAMEVHELTDQSPEIIYVNQEQRPQPRPSQAPTQATVDRAFKGKQRLSKNIARLGKRRVCLLNGKSTGNIGVIQAMDSNGCPIHVTSVERTLIDITVRPAYSGGIYEVLGAFKRAADRVQVNQLLAYLRKMDFAYPYEQAIGFYMERSGAYPDRRLKQIEAECNRELDFYLGYGIKESDYSSRWRIFFPTGF